MTQDQPVPDSTDRPRPQDRPGAAKAGKAEAASQAAGLPSRALLRTSVGVGLIALCVLLSVALWLANDNYGEVRGLASDYFAGPSNAAAPVAEGPTAEGSGSATELPFRPDLAMLYTLNASRAQDMLFIKAVALLTAFAMVLFGCLFVLSGIRQNYELSIQKGEAQSALRTSSPGLVLITLGSALVAFALTSKTTLETNINWGGAVQTGSTEVASAASESGSSTAQGSSTGSTQVSYPGSMVNGTWPGSFGSSSGSTTTLSKLDELELQVLVLEQQRQRVLRLGEELPEIELAPELGAFDYEGILKDVTLEKRIEALGADEVEELPDEDLELLRYDPEVPSRKELFEKLQDPSTDPEGRHLWQPAEELRPSWGTFAPGTGGRGIYVPRRVEYIEVLNGQPSGRILPEALIRGGGRIGSGVE